jgi:hypothetical protein
MKLHAALDVSRGHVGTLNKILCLGFVCKHESVLHVNECSRNTVCFPCTVFYRNDHSRFRDYRHFKPYNYLVRFSNTNLYVIARFINYYILLQLYQPGTCTPLFACLSVSLALQPSAGYGLRVYEVLWSHTTTSHNR